MYEINVNQWMDLAVRAAKKAGTLSQERLKQPLDVTCKTGYSDLVTAVDVAVEKMVVDEILRHYPHHGILGEEGTCEQDTDACETMWVIDPIDGTTNFIHQQQNYAVSIAVYHKGEGMIGVVYDPSRDELFTALKGQGAYLNGQRLQLCEKESLEQTLLCTSGGWSREAIEANLNEKIMDLALKCRGLRLLGCASLEMAYVAAGRFDAYLSLSLNPWDFGAGKILVEEAGGRMSRLLGDEIAYDKKGSILTAVPGVYQELLSYMKGKEEA